MVNKDDDIGKKDIETVLLYVKELLQSEIILEHHHPRSKEGIHPVRSSNVRNAVTPMRSDTRIRDQ